MEIEPIELIGNWKAGWAMDYHTISSKFLSEGHFETKRTELGELLYQLKYEEDDSKVKMIAQLVVDFLKTRLVTPYLSALIPIPPSKQRNFQPVYEIVKEIGNLINVKVDLDYLIKTKPTSELKDIEDYETRINILRNHFELKDTRYKSKKVMLFDDLYRSGATMNVISQLFLEKGKVDRVYVLTLTKTRVKK